MFILQLNSRVQFYQSYKRKLVDCILIDETFTRLALRISPYYFIQYDKILDIRLYISLVRNKVVTEKIHYINLLIMKPGIYTGGDALFCPESCKLLKLKDIIHSPLENSLI